AVYAQKEWLIGPNGNLKFVERRLPAKSEHLEISLLPCPACVERSRSQFRRELKNGIDLFSRKERSPDVLPRELGTHHFCVDPHQSSIGDGDEGEVVSVSQIKGKARTDQLRLPGWLDHETQGFRFDLRIGGQDNAQSPTSCYPPATQHFISKA